MKHYFVDYENVNQPGLQIDDNIAQKIEGEINIFYTDKCQHINMDIIQKITLLEGKIQLFHVKNGIKNALDFQLSTYLGYCISEYGSADEYIIISKDTGFDRVVWFWESRKEIRVKISRSSDIQSAITGRKAVSIQTEDEHDVYAESCRIKPQDFEGTKLNKSYRQNVADICNTYKNKNDIHNALVGIYHNEGKTIYRQIQKVLTNLL